MRPRHRLAVVIGAVFGGGVLVLQPAGAADHTVEIKGLSFIPEEIAIGVGDQITWVNEDDDDHDLRSDTFDAPPMKKGQTFSFTFSRPDVIEYRCQIHTYMQGKVTVGDGQPSGGSPPPAEEPSPSTEPTTTTTRGPSGPLGLPLPIGAG
ncbi:MAG: plastocyanin/azurin family copper-binding protein [Acidimicrobiia bacterium]